MNEYTEGVTKYMSCDDNENRNTPVLKTEEMQGFLGKSNEIHSVKKMVLSNC